MLRIVWSQVIRRRGRSLAVVAAIVVAAVSFSLLTSAVATSRLQVKGKVEENFRSAYDILVRPRNSITPLESSDRLVQQNYLSGIFGGITSKQYHQIRAIPGVKVAAPIAMVGYTLPTLNMRVVLNDLLDRSQQQVLRVDFRWRSDRGLSEYPSPPVYVYATRQPFLRGPGYQPQADPATGRVLHVCASFFEQLPARSSAFSQRAGTGLVCSSTTTPDQLPPEGLRKGQIGVTFLYPFPLMVAAINPRAEARLVGLKGAVTSGRYLTASDQMTTHTSKGRGVAGIDRMRYHQVPMLMSRRLVTDQDLRLVISRVDVGPQDRVPGRLVAADAVDWLSSRPRRELRSTQLPGRDLYPRLLDVYQSNRDSANFPMQYWSASQVQYSTAANGHLQPRYRRNEPLTWISSTSGFLAPPEAADVAFRELTVHRASNLIYGNTYASPVPQVVGQFDPREITGFSKLSQVPLTTYYPPSAAPGDQRARRLLHGRSLLPSSNLAGYLQQPPLLLTTLRSLPAFYDPQAFTTLVDGVATHDNVGKAPISVIRVRVAGVTGADKNSRERVRLVAEQIVRTTGLDVDITIGSSPTPQLVDLPAGKYGRPDLTLEEGWVKKGVAVQLLNSIDTKSLSLFVLVLLVCSLFLLNAVTAAVRSRAAELGILSCLGWSRRKIFWLLESELLVTGLIAGLAGTLITTALVHTLGLDVKWAQLALVTPVSVLLSGLAGLPPTRQASRAIPMQAVQQAIRPPRRTRAVNSITKLGLVGVGRTPGRSVLAAASLFIGVAALAALLAIQQQFAHNAVGTLLGDVLAIQVRAVDLFAAILILALGAFTIADVAYLNISERHAEIGTLRATGWTEHHVRRLFATEALAIAAAGAVAGAALGVAATGLLLHADTAILVRAAAVAAATGMLAAAIALVAPLARLSKLAPAGMLNE